MSHTITPVAQYDAAAITLPDDGDANTIESLDPAFQKLADRDELALSGIASRLAWSEELSVDPGGSASSFAVNIGAIQLAVLVRDGVYRPYFANAATIGASKIEGGGNLQNSTWYYVYLWDNAGVVDYQISTTPPRASRQYKNAVGNVFRYLGCFVTNPSGAPLPFRANRGRYVYRLSAITTADIRALSTSTTIGAATDVILARGGTAGQELIPPHARMARVQVAAGGAGGNALVILFTKGDSAGISFRLHIPDGVTSYAEVDIETDASRTVQYTFSLSGGTGNAFLYVAGFYE